MDGYPFQFHQCFSINFGYQDDQISIPQISMTPDSNTNSNFESPSSCNFVIIGCKYLNKIGKVMEKVNSVTNDVGGIRPIAVFLMTRTKKNVNIDVDYDVTRYKVTPVMVK